MSQITMNDQIVRNLAGKSSGQISLGDIRGLKAGQITLLTGLSSQSANKEAYAAAGYSLIAGSVEFKATYSLGVLGQIQNQQCMLNVEEVIFQVPSHLPPLFLKHCN